MTIRLIFLLLILTTFDLITAELPTKAQKVIDKSTQSIAEIQEKANEAIVKIKTTAVKKLEKLLKKTKKTNAPHIQAIKEQISILNDEIRATSTGTLDQRESTLIRNLKANKKQTVVAYGTSLTHYGAWVKQCGAALKADYPNLLDLINSGASGRNSKWGVQNLQERVLDKNPDTVFIEFSMNDCVTRANCPIEMAKENLVFMLDSILALNKNCEIILMTVTPGKEMPEGDRHHRTDIEGHYEMYRTVAKKYNLKLIDHFVNWKALQNSDSLTFKTFVPDAIHPNVKGCAEIITPAVLQALKGKQQGKNK